jgi:hypothetical protein
MSSRELVLQNDALDCNNLSSIFSPFVLSQCCQSVIWDPEKGVQSRQIFHNILCSAVKVSTDLLPLLIGYVS